MNQKQIRAAVEAMLFASGSFGGMGGGGSHGGGGGRGR